MKLRDYKNNGNIGIPSGSNLVETNNSLVSLQEYDLEAKLNILQQGCKEALHYLKKKIKSFRYRYKLPWYLVIGPNNVGKTTLLAKSNLDLVSISNIPLKNITHTYICDWWFSKESVFIDISGSLIFSKDLKMGHLFWSGFLKLLKKFRRAMPVNGIIITVEFNQLYDEGNQDNKSIIDYLHLHIQALTKYFNRIPVYLVLTKCDQIAGFNEFFDHMSSEEAEQAFGIHFSPNAAHRNFSSIFSENYDKLIKNLNNQLLWRIHQEHNISKRNSIREFPLQMESQKSYIENLACQIHNQQTPLCGIYFVSSLAEGSSHDYLLQPLANAFNLSIPQHEKFISSQKSFFINNVFKTIISESHISQIRSHKPCIKHYYALAAALILSLVCLFWTVNYQKNLNTINSIKEVINQNINSSYEYSSPYNYLNKLSLLHDAINRPYLKSYFGFGQVKRFHTELTNQYQQMLNQQFIPQLVNILENQIQAADSNHPEQLYAALKVYFMLGNKDVRDENYIEQYFANYWKNTLSDQTNIQLQLNKNLRALLSEENINVKEDPLIITSARQILNATPLANLSFALLRDKYINQNNNIALNSSFFAKPSLQIPTIYMADHFNEVYQRDIPELIQHIAQGDWVLGTKPALDLNSTNTKELINDVRSLYIQNYIETWLTQISSLHMANMDNLAAVKTIIKDFNSNNSPIKQVLTFAELNIKPISSQPDLQQIAKVQLEQFNELVNYTNNINLHNELQNLENYSNTISHSANADEAAFNIAVLRMNNNGGKDVIADIKVFAEQAPAPFNNLLIELAKNTWQSILNEAKNYINQAWQKQVLPIYNDVIANRYPFIKTASSEVSMDNFAKFFNSSGTFNNFYNNYLRAFVDTSQLYWTWKNIDGLHLNISQENLEVFIRSSLINKIFFANNNNPHIKFILTPISFAPNTSNVFLNIGGQQINSTSLNKNIQFTWPNSEGAALSFISKDGQKSSLTANGTWAFFKLLDHAAIEPTSDPKTYKATFNINGNIIQYEITTERLINPFISGLFANFKCSDSL